MHPSPGSFCSNDERYLALSKKLETVAQGRGDHAIFKLQQDHLLRFTPPTIWAMAAQDGVPNTPTALEDPEPAASSLAAHELQDDGIWYEPGSEWARLALAQATQLWRSVFDGNQVLIERIVRQVCSTPIPANLTIRELPESSIAFGLLKVGKSGFSTMLPDTTRNTALPLFSR